MANCVFCGKETSLHVNDIPICVVCDDERTSSHLGRPRDVCRDGERQRPPKDGGSSLTDKPYPTDHP